jgi:two-component system sensor histidine kinase KdpD
VTANALRYSPAGSPPLLTADAHGVRVELRVADRGPGVPEADRDRMFVPFQRLGDTGSTSGVGLGLTVSRGLAEAMGGTMKPEETQGGGLTMAISIPVVPGPAQAHPGSRGRRARRDRVDPLPNRDQNDTRKWHGAGLTQTQHQAIRPAERAHLVAACAAQW